LLACARICYFALASQIALLAPHFFLFDFQNIKKEKVRTEQGDLAEKGKIVNCPLGIPVTSFGRRNFTSFP